MRSNNWHWYTDGIANVAVRDGDLVPAGFYRGRAFSSTTRKKLSSSAIARGPNNKGKKFSEGARKNIQEARRRFFENNPDWVSPTQWKSGNVPWSKGHVFSEEELHHRRIVKSNNLQAKAPVDVCSNQEFRFYTKLCTVLDPEDIICQYTSDAYPFICDFYIIPLDLYIECQYHWSHNDHRFDPTSPSDLESVEKFRENLRKGEHETQSKMYLKIWASSDVRKFEIAKSNGLNYVMLYKEEDEDALIRRIQSTICAD